MEKQTKSYATPAAIVIGAAIIALSLGNDRPKYQMVSVGDARLVRMNTATGRAVFCRLRRVDVGDGTRGRITVDCSGQP